MLPYDQSVFFNQSNFGTICNLSWVTMLEPVNRSEWSLFTSQIMLPGNNDDLCIATQNQSFEEVEQTLGDALAGQTPYYAANHLRANTEKLR